MTLLKMENLAHFRFEYAAVPVESLASRGLGHSTALHTRASHKHILPALQNYGLHFRAKNTSANYHVVCKYFEILFRIITKIINSTHG
jgi:hypothetical protein